jgi:hypothetical protein
MIFLTRVRIFFLYISLQRLSPSLRIRASIDPNASTWTSNELSVSLSKSPLTIPAVKIYSSRVFTLAKQRQTKCVILHERTDNNRRPFAVRFPGTPQALNDRQNRLMSLDMFLAPIQRIRLRLLPSLVLFRLWHCHDDSLVHEKFSQRGIGRDKASGA